MIVSAVVGYVEYTQDDMAHISLIATLEEYRKIGFAHKLLIEFLNRAKHRNLTGVDLFCNKMNKTAMYLYENIGFCIFEQKREVIHYIYYFDKERE